MESHPKFHEVADACNKVPARKRVIFQTFMDLKYVQLFKSVQAQVIDGLDIPVILTNESTDNIQGFVPVFAAEEFSVVELASIVDKIQAALVAANSPRNLTHVHLAIVESDSTIVYYKIDHCSIKLQASCV
ncbi:tRNA intron endonuclease [Coemansia mojavensis]|nr:tRNA intron endonuclease [Coemansia mojavensis]